MKVAKYRTHDKSAGVVMKKLIQHYRNGRNWGDSWLFITKMELTGNLLTDEKYRQHLSTLFTKKNCISSGDRQWENNND